MLLLLICGAVCLVLVVLVVLFFPFGNVVESEKHGGEIAAEVLKAHGVKFVFTLVGGHISPILVECEKKGVRVVDVRMEANAVFAADAVSRLSGVPGVAAVTAGPGVTNTITAVKNAQMAQSPLVLIGGAAATLLKGRGALQDIDQMVLLRPLCKYCASCSSVKDIAPTLRKAFQAAQSGVPGPVFVELPIDTLYPIAEVRSNMGLGVRKRAREIKKDDPAEMERIILPVEAVSRGESKKAFLDSKRADQPVFLAPGNENIRLPFVVKTYLEFALRKLFAGAWEGQSVVYDPLPVSIPAPPAEHITKVLAMLQAAERPVLLVGSQAMLDAGKADELQKAILKLGIPTFLGGMSRGLLGRNNPQHIRQNRRVALKKADLVIMAGAVADFRLDYGRVLSKRSKVVAINRSSKDLKQVMVEKAGYIVPKQNSDLFWKPALASVSDPGDFVRKLASTASTSAAKALVSKYAGWCKELKDMEVAKELANAKKGQEPAYGQPALGRGKERLLNPIDLCNKVEAIMSDNSILIADGGDFVATAAYVVRPRGPLTWLDPGAFGTLGVGGGFALGAKLCRPDAEVWLIWGDGSAGYSIAEFDTFKRHNVPIIALIGNDACWTQIEREQIPILDSNVACPLAYCNYEHIAQGYVGPGGNKNGIAIDKPDGDVVKQLNQAQASAKAGEPVCVNVHIGSTNFREGSLSV